MPDAVSAGRIIISVNVSIDGVAEDPDGLEGTAFGGWFGSAAGSDLAAWTEIQLAEARDAAAILLGRNSADWFGSRWPQRSGEWADLLNGLPKYVVGSLGTVPSWSPATLVSGDLSAETPQLKRLLTGDIFVYGSLTLARELLRKGLADEVRLTVFPIVVGAGRRLFDGLAAPVPLRLVASRQVGAGLLVQSYAPLA